jgi:hypothetical protein
LRTEFYFRQRRRDVFFLFLWIKQKKKTKSEIWDKSVLVVWLWSFEKYAFGRSWRRWRIVTISSNSWTWSEQQQHKQTTITISFIQYEQSELILTIVGCQKDLMIVQKVWHYQGAI